MYKCEVCKRNIGPCVPESHIHSFKEDASGNKQIASVQTVCPICELSIIGEDKKSPLTVATCKKYFTDKKFVFLRSEFAAFSDAKTDESS